MAISDRIKKLGQIDFSEIDLASLDFDNIGSWPTPVKSILVLLLFAVVLGAGYWFYLKDLQIQLESTARQEQQLKESFGTKAFQAANLDQYREQMKEMEESFGTLLQQLPKDTEVPGLLEDITHTGLGSGLEFQSIRLQPEIKREIYVELPIEIVVTGSYHDLGTFVSGVAALPRIVTLHEFSLRPDAGSGLLTARIIAKTYRYKDGAGQ